MTKTFLFFLVLVSVLTTSFSSNILFFHLMATSSHRTAIWPLAEELANSGHNLTYIYPIPGIRVGSHPQVEEITPSKVVPLLKEFVADFDINIRLNHTYNQWVLKAFQNVESFCEAVYDSPEIKEWLQRPNLSYDLVLIDSAMGECGYGFVHKFQAKHILFAPLMVPFMFDPNGIVPETSSVPDFFFHPKPNQISFFSRMASTIMTLLWRYKYALSFEGVHKAIKRKLNFTHFPQIEEFERNASLLLLNNYFVEEYPMSFPPMIQSFSGLWCSKKYLKKEINKLPEEMERFVEGGEDGFMYVSLGSAVDVSLMPVTMRNEFFQGFESFPKLRFLWKWNGPRPEGTPKNVLMGKWFPQRDILAHSKIRGFISQGGRPSSQEALCYAVPIINIPVFGDQDYNANRLEQLGISIIVSIDNFNGTELKNAIQEILTNPSYKANMLQMSKMFKDRPIDPLENAVFWTEYVLRHDNNDMSLLKPLGIKQSWYERRLIDVYAALMLLFVLISAAIFLVYKILFKKVMLTVKCYFVKEKTL